MKILKRVISVTIWVVIALNVVLAGVSRMPAAQQYIGSKVASAIGERLGTRVSIGRVDLGFLNRIIIDDLVVMDQQQQEMLRASRLTAKIDFVPLAEGKISISSAQLFGAHARLYRRDSLAKPNFQFVVDSLASSDTTHTPLDLRINSLIIRHSSVAYDQLDRPLTVGRFNPSHLSLGDISAHLNLRKLTDDSLSVNVKRIGFNEHSGLTVNSLSFRLEAGCRSAILSDLKLQMPSTHLETDTVAATYRLNEQGIETGSLSYYGGTSNASITPSDLRCFNPSLKNFQRPISVETSFQGTDRRIDVPLLRLDTEAGDLAVNVGGWLERRERQSAWHMQMDHILLTDNSLDFLTKAIPQIPAEVRRIGGLQMSGTFDRDWQGITSLKSQIQSGAGNADLQFTMDRQQTFESRLKTDGLNLRQLLEQEQLGSVAAELTLHGQLHPQREPDIRAEGTVSQLDYNGYSYKNINLNGEYAQQTFSGTCSIDDPNVGVRLQGMVTGLATSGRRQTRTIQAEATIERLRPSAIGLTDQWGEADFSGDIQADFTATSLNDAQGSIRISRCRIFDPVYGAPYLLDNLILTSGYDQDIHFLSLKSDFADATLRGAFDYQTLPQSITNLVGSILPTLPGLPSTSHKTDNNFSLRLMMTKSDWLQRLFGIDLTLRQPLMLQARVNDRTQDLYLDGDMPSFTYNGARYTDGNIHVTTPGDTLDCGMHIRKIDDDGQALSANLLVRAANNKMNTSLTWDNHQEMKQASGELNSTIQLYRNLENQPEAHLRIQPSHMVFNGATWDVEPSDIIYNKRHLLVDNFMIRRGSQHIIVDGIASKDPGDSLVVDLSNVEVAYILDLVDFHTVDFSGKATGRAVGHALFDKFGANAALRVDGFRFEEGRMGVLYADVGWNSEKEQIDIKAVAEDGPGVNTYIDGFVSPTHSIIDLAIRADSTYIDFMHSFTKSFLSHATGHASGDVRLAGPLDNINLTGRLVVDGEATVEALNTTYYMERDTIVLIPDEIALHRLPLRDKEGHQAWLSGGIHHQHLTHLTFDLSVEADNLLAYDFPSFGDSNFHGTIYASGNVDIKGRPGEVTIDCDVTPLRNSVFVYDAANPDAISNQEFIEWQREPGHGASDLGDFNQGSRPLDHSTSTDIYLNFQINATPEATLRLLMDASTNDYITLNGEGAIRASYHNKGAFNMFGTYTVTHGTYGITIQNIITKNFMFNSGGTITFGGDPYQAALNLQAVNTVSGVSLSDLSIGNSFSSNTIRVNCLMNISGQAAAPQVDFDLEMPTVNADEQQMVRSVINGQQEMNQQVIYLLSLGRFYQPRANNANDTQTDQTSRTMQSLLSGTLTAQINNLISQFIKNDNWNFGANITTGNEGWHNAEYEGTVNARMLNNRLLLNGQFGYRDNATQANPSFIGDFDLQYLLYPNGNLALKVYNQTNDRYFTKSSLNTQGLGLIMKKDFNGLRDLFSSQKKKKRKKK